MQSGMFFQTVENVPMPVRKYLNDIHHSRGHSSLSMRLKRSQSCLEWGTLSSIIVTVVSPSLSRNVVRTISPVAWAQLAHRPIIESISRCIVVLSLVAVGIARPQGRAFPIWP